MRVRFRDGVEHNAMKTRGLHRNRGESAPLTNAAGPLRSRAEDEALVPCASSAAEASLDRLLAMMARWWDGWAVARIAREHGVTRQRAASLLAEVGCTRARLARRGVGVAGHRAADADHATERSAFPNCRVPAAETVGTRAARRIGV